MSSSRVIADLVLALTPIHEVAARFAAGGAEIGRLIEKIHAQLIEIEPDVRGDDDDELEEAKEEIERLEGELERASEPLLKAGLIKEPLA
jgi:hypothetical protein